MKSRKADRTKGISALTMGAAGAPLTYTVFCLVVEVSNHILINLFTDLIQTQFSKAPAWKS